MVSQCILLKESLQLQEQDPVEQQPLPQLAQLILHQLLNSNNLILVEWVDLEEVSEAWVVWEVWVASQIWPQEVDSLECKV